jgi:hypothetical protein
MDICFRVTWPVTRLKYGYLFQGDLASDKAQIWLFQGDLASDKAQIWMFQGDLASDKAQIWMKIEAIDSFRQGNISFHCSTSIPADNNFV